MRKILWLILLLLAAIPAEATTTVTGTLQNLGTGTVGQAAFVRFWLRGCGGNIPRVSGTAVIAPSQGGVYYFDLVAASNGAISGTLYSTRDAAGTGNGDIECGGSKTAVWYGMQVWLNGKAGAEVPVHAKNGVTLDITQATPITTNPVVTAPTGDSTYLRLDAGNSPVTGNVGFTGNNTHSGTETFTGAPAISATNAGVFTNTQSQFYLQSLLNSCNPTTEFHFSQGNTNNTTDGLTGCLTVPNGATVHQGNAVAGYVNTSCNSASRTVCNAVGGYFWGRDITSNSAVWGINGIVNDTPATTGTNVQASELDIGIAGTPSFVCGQCLNLSGTGLGTGTMPATSYGFSISTTNGLAFNFGYVSGRGASTTAGLYLDGQNTTNNTFSQTISLVGYDGGGTAHTAQINATPLGSVNLTPVAGQYMTLPAGTGTELIEGTAPSGVATTDVCYGDSTLHMKKCSYNNGPFLPMPQTNNAGGTHSDSGLYQTKRAVAGCTTGAAAGNSCASDITVTWGTAFADANYSVTCTGSTPTNVPSAPFVVSASKLAASVHINYFAITAAAASYATIDCIAVHD